MVRCVVKCCQNNSDQRRSDVSFFRLPSNDVLREGWLRKIDEVKLPNKNDFARICSDHFSEECFSYGKKCKIRQLKKMSMPTLFLTSPKVREDGVNLNFNVIRRNFSLLQSNNIAGSEPVIVERKCESPSVDCYAAGSSNHEVENGSRVLAEYTPSPRYAHNDPAAATTPPNSVGELCSALNKTFPERFHRSKVLCGRLGVVRRKHVQNTTKTLRSRLKRSGRDTARDEVMEYVSDENVPVPKRRRLFTNNCDENGVSNTPREVNDDTLQTIESLQAEVKHYKHLSDFHLKSRCAHRLEEEEHKKEIETLKLEVKKKNDQMEHLLTNIHALKDIVKDLETKLQKCHSSGITKIEENPEHVRDLLKDFFTEGQIRCIIQKRKWVHWSIDDYAAAISLRSISPKAYRYLRLKLHFPLPSLSSLRRWALKSFDIREGFLGDVFAIMKDRSKSLPEMEKIAVITFDEMSLSPEPCFDTKVEKLIGPFQKVQVIMCRGLFSNWKQPIFYKFDQPMTKTILLESVQRLHHSGYEVVGVTSDLGNKGVWGELKITPDNFFFQHPLIEGGQIFVFADVPHLLKLLRNWFVDEGLLLGNCKTLFTANVYEAIIKLGLSGDLRIAHQITDRILHVVGSARQAVRPAARIWSHTASKAIEWAGNEGLIDIPEYEKFAYFVFTVNKWFDVQNSNAKYGKHAGVNGFGVDLESQVQCLVLMSMYIENMRVGKRTTLMPFQKSILISNASLQGLFKYLQNKYPESVKYILTRRVQQDILENFFSYIRAMGSGKDNPTAYDFRYRLRWYILGKHSHAVFTMNRNTEEDESTVCLSSITSSLASDSTFRDVAETEDNTPLAMSTPFPGITLYASQSADVELASQPNKDTSQSEEVILTAELLKDIVNISSDDLLDDASANTDNNGSDRNVHNDTLENDDAELTRFIERYYEASTSTVKPKNPTDVIHDAGMEYVAGYVAHRFKNLYPLLGDKTKDVVGNDNHSCVHTVSKGYLTYPSQTLLLATKIVEKCFLEFHGQNFSSEDLVIQKVVKMVKETPNFPKEVPEEVLQCLVRTRTHIRVKEMWKKFIDNKEQRRKEKK